MYSSITCVSLLSTVVLALLPGYCCLSGVGEAGIDTCPPWFKYNGSSCVCGDTKKTGGTVICEQDRNVSQLLLDYCMTFDEQTNDTFVFYCPYDTMKNNGRFVSLTNVSVSDLTNFTCRQHRKRNGTYCQYCLPDHGPSVFTESLTCARCDKAYSGWWLYFTLEYLPLTVFFFIIVATGISPRSGNLNSFILLSQLVSLLFAYGNQAQLIPPFGMAYEVVVKVLRVFYGFWNLAFFRGIARNFCVSSELNNLEAISLHLLPPFYPFFLLAIGYVFISLYQCNCPLLVRIWKPFRRCLSHYPVPNDLRLSFINLSVTFYLLGCTKLLFTCVSLLVRGSLFKLNGETSTVLLMSPDVLYFSSEHAPYAGVSLVLFFTIILLPAIYLVLHPLLEKRFSRLQRTTVLKMTVDAFSSCFRDGKDGRMDCRHFAGGYLLLRVILVMLFSVIWSPLVTYVILFVIFALTALTVGLCRPYKRRRHNVLDIVLFSLFAIGILFATLAANLQPSNNSFQIAFSVFVLVSFTVPLLYAASYITYRLAKLIILLILCLWRRRHHQYEEITTYEDDFTSSNDRHYSSVQNE